MGILSAIETFGSVSYEQPSNSSLSTLTFGSSRYRSGRLSMRLVSSALAIVLLVAAHAAAQQPEAGAWFGISRTSTGRQTNERFEVEARETNAVIRSAPLGKTPSSWGPISLRQDSSIEFPWAANPPLLCVL